MHLLLLVDGVTLLLIIDARVALLLLVDGVSLLLIIEARVSLAAVGRRCFSAADN